MLWNLDFFWQQIAGSGQLLVDFKISWNVFKKKFQFFFSQDMQDVSLLLVLVLVAVFSWANLILKINI